MAPTIIQSNYNMTRTFQLRTGSKRSAQKVRLPLNFEPGTYSVICGRGKLCSASPGNKHLRFLVHQNLAPYSNAANKAEKSAIVSGIINYVRELSPGGAFVKQEDNGEWWEVDDSFAREKIGCIFRDILHTQYRSSTKAKQARKKAQEFCSEGPPSLNQEPWNEVKFAGTSCSQPEASCTTIHKVMGKLPTALSLPITARNMHAFYTKKINTDMLYIDRGAVTPDESSSSPNMSGTFSPSTKVDPLNQDQNEQRTASFLLSTTASPSRPATCIRKPTTLSLLEDALGVVDLDDDIVDEDLPDDLSDIFDEDTMNSLCVW